jgi:hypothetical protein
MHHLNYSRQFAKTILDGLKQTKSLTKEQSIMAREVLRLHQHSVKFILPNGGRPMFDPQFRALDDSERLRLPFPCIALEYECRGFENPWSVIYDAQTGKTNQIDPAALTNLCTKRIVYAEEIDYGIYVRIAYYSDDEKVWNFLPPAYIEGTNYFFRGVEKDPMIAFRADTSVYSQADYIDELTALMCFLNVTQCSNVRHEVSRPKKEQSSKSALGFDTYRVLMVDVASTNSSGLQGTTHRSPREHLRRGHIRRLNDGRKIWVNAAVIGANKGAGVIHKDYALPAN